MAPPDNQKNISAKVAVDPLMDHDLPPAYREALDQLLFHNSVDSKSPLTTLHDSDILELAQEMLSNFYDSQSKWSNAEEWALEEAKLYKLKGRAKEISIGSAKLVMAQIFSDYLSTFINAIECKLNKKNEPELLAKKRTVGKDVVYGPVNASTLLPGTTFEVWTSPSNQTNVEQTDNSSSGSIGKIAVVLGAGNQSSLTLVDVLENTLRHRRPVVLKHHPLRPWLAGPYSILLEPLIQKGYVRQVQDVNVEITKQLLSLPIINHVHITGAYNTSKAVQSLLQTTNPTLSDPKIKSMITSELGCATPQILDDGMYSDKELQHAARMIATGKKTNGGCNCLSPQVVLLPKNWSQKDLFRQKLIQELTIQPTVPCYYPGSLLRKKSIVEQAKKFGSKCTTVVAQPLSEETDVTDDDQVVLIECGTPGEEGYNPSPLLLEAFGPVLAIVELANNTNNEDSKDDDTYLKKNVVPFLNQKENIFGTLCCSIYTPESKGNSQRQSLQKALSELQYGSIAINQMTLFGYGPITRGGMWGGHSLEKNCQSGNGNIGDLYGIIGNEVGKGVVYGPPLETKPVVDNSNPPPLIVVDVICEFYCNNSLVRGFVRAATLVIMRSVYGTMSYIPIIGRYFQ